MFRIRKIIGKNKILMNIWIVLHNYKAPIGTIIKNSLRVHRLKNKYQGKRCFIIGNGPSLKGEDLDLIKNEYAFAANSICKIFEKTIWRPTFYCVQDEKVLKKLGDDLFSGSKNAKYTFIRLNSYDYTKDKIDRIPNLLYIPILEFKIRNEGVKFSNKLSLYAGDGWTVTYMSIQLAAYMGFKEIYLLGVDHSFPFERKRDGSMELKDINIAAHFYETASDNVYGDPSKMVGNFHERVTNGYITAEKYSRKTRKFKIYNCTRGGALEVFERKKLEDIIQKDDFVMKQYKTS